MPIVTATPTEPPSATARLPANRPATAAVTTVMIIIELANTWLGPRAKK